MRAHNLEVRGETSLDLDAIIRPIGSPLEPITEAEVEAAASQVPIKYLVNDDPELRLRVGRYLAVIRKRRGISQESAAKMVRLTRPHLSNVELGRSRAGWSRLGKIAEIYNIPLEQAVEEARVYDFEGPLVAEGSADRNLREDIFTRALMDRNLAFGLKLNEYEKSIFQLFTSLPAEDRAEVCERIRALIMLKRI